MAEVNNDPPTTPEPTKQEKVNPRRYSLSSSSSSASAPSYLRASTGSCHDFCKFGKSHSCETKPKNPFHRKLIRKSSEDEILAKSAVFSERKKTTPVNRPKSSAGSETRSLDSPDALIQKGLNSERRNSVRGDLEKKTTPAATIKSSLNSSTLSVNAKKPVKKDAYPTNEASKRILSTNETSKRNLSTNETSKRVAPTSETSKRVPPANQTSKRVPTTNETSKGGLPKPKERTLSGSLVASVKSSSLPLRRLSISGSSSMSRLQRSGDTNARESSGTKQKVLVKNLSMPSSASPTSKPSISQKVAVKNIPRTTLGKQVTLNGTPTRKSKDIVKDVEVAKASDKEELTEKNLPINVNVEETESRTSEPFTNVSVDESIAMEVEETESKTLEVVTDSDIDGVVADDVEETETKTLDVVGDSDIDVDLAEDAEETENQHLEEVASKNIDERVVMTAEETESKPLETVADKNIDERLIVNVEEMESKPVEAVADKNIDKSVVVNAEGTGSKALEAVTDDKVDESIVVKVEETERKPLEAIMDMSINENIVVNVDETESKPLESAANESVPEGIISNVEEPESKTSGPVPNVCVAESSSLSPIDSPLQEEDQTESDYTMSESEDYSASEYDETDLIQPSEASVDVDGKTKTRKGGNHRPEDDESPKPTKLRFRRGRVVDVQHKTNAPRRLRFRRARLLSETQNDGTRRSSLKRREENEGENNNDETQEGSEKVVLRQCDVQEKKDAKGLFNNVIEETASKLVETRKSKVKALVGAFETVISLQDSKPSANT